MNSETKEDALEIIRAHLPSYLTPDLKDKLFSAVKDHFPLSIDADLIYEELPDKDIYYQGDAIIDIPFSIFNNGSFEVNYLSGIVMSNTCDISPENERMEKPIIQFSSIFLLDDYITLLKNKGIGDSRIESFISDLKRNKISNLFYLPKKVNDGKLIYAEAFVRFDSNVSLSSKIFENETYNKAYMPSGDRIFSFSNYGFYLFIIKLSIHYCRFREGVFRNSKD